MKKISRNYALDIIRIFALFCVVSVHFFLKSGYYGIFVRGYRMYVATLVRSFFMICVPLFLLLSGYLMKKKSPTKQYYFKLTRILVEYLLASICCIVYTVMANGMSGNGAVFFANQICSLFSYKAAPYGWYVEMYIGLYLIIPFLNIIYNNLKTQREKQKLIFTMLFLTAIPCVTNAFVFDVGNQQMTFKMLPEWWNGIYPISYYCLGAYLSEYPVKLKKSVHCLLIFLMFLLSGTFNYWKCNGDLFQWGDWQNYESVFVVIQSTLIFTLLLQCSCKPGGIRENVFAYLSDRCFCAYLVSYIFDDMIYRLSGWFDNMMVYRLELYVVTVPFVFLMSLLMSSLIHEIYCLCQKTAKHIFGSAQSVR